jgi:integrase
MRSPKKSKTYGLFKSCRHLSWDKCECPWLGRHKHIRYVNLGEWAGIHAPSKTRALEILAEVKRSIKDGSFSKEGKRLEGKGMSLKGFITLYRRYLIDDKGIADEKDNHLHSVLRLWEKELGEYSLATYTSPLAWELWLTERKSKGKWTTNAPWNRYRAYGKAMFSWGMRPKIGLTSRNPFLEIDPKQETRTKPPRLEDVGVTEETLLNAVATAYPPVPDHPKLDALHEKWRLGMTRRLIVALDTGLRKKEIAHLQIKHINFKTWALTLPTSKGKTKTGEEEQVFAMTPRLQQILESRRFLGDEAFVFGTEGGEFQNGWRKGWKSVFKAAGLPSSFKWHSTRHEFISVIAEMTDNVQEVKELARHRSITTTEGYMKAKEERLKMLLTRKAERA